MYTRGRQGHSEGVQHLVRVTVERHMDAVMDYVLDATHLPQWSFFTSAEPQDGHWRVTTPEGGATLTFVALHEPGVLDHVVVTDDGQHVVVPMRISQHAHTECCEISLVVDAPADRLPADVATVEADLARLKQLVEAL